MKKRVWKGKRLFSLLLAFVMLASIMPLELLVGSISPREEPADISVVMSAEPEKVALNGTSTVTLAVTLADKIDCATIHIKLDEDEISAIQNPFWENTEGDTDAVLLDESADSAGEVTETTVTRVEGGLEIQTNEHEWTQTFSVSYPGTAPETLAENESSLTDEPKEYTFSIGNEDISLKSYEWAEDNAAGQGSQDDETLLIPLEPSTPVTDPISDGTDSLESEEETPIQTDPSIETQEPNVSEPSEEPEVPESEQQEGGDTPVEELETPEPNQSGNSAEQEPSKEGQNSDSDQEDEESDQRAEAATKNEVGESADYETMTLSAAAVYSEDGNDSDQENSGEDAEEKEPTTYFQGVTVIFTDQEEEQAPENPEFTLSLSTDSKNSSITPVDRKLPDFTFTATAKLNEDAVVAEGDSISFQLQIQLPEGITFPEGIYFSEVDTNGITVQYTGTDSTGGEVITIPLPEGVTVKDIGESDIAQVSEDLSTLTLSITQAIHPAESSGEPTASGDSSGAGEPAAPITEWDYTVTVKGEPLTVSESFQEGQITSPGWMQRENLSVRCRKFPSTQRKLQYLKIFGLL